MSITHNASIAEAYRKGLDCADCDGDPQKDNEYFENTEQHIAWRAGYVNRREWKAKHGAG